MVATVKQKTVYKCEVCDKTHNTLKAAEKCENSHEETRIKQEKEAAERMKIHDALVNIRMTSQSFTELNERALSVLKEHYGDDFILEINIRGLSRCTYVLTKAPKKNDFFSDVWRSNKGIEASDILRTIGFKTGSGGGGDGKVYSYYCTYSIGDFPMIQQKMQEREIAVITCKTQVKELANNTMKLMHEDAEYVSFTETEENLQLRISILQEQLDKITAEKQKYIKDNFYTQYEAKACDMIKALPQQFKSEFPDPYPSAYF